jgi:hypothetical protein
MIKIIGYLLLAISCVLFIMIPVVPWFDFSKSQIAVISTVLIIAGEVLFYLSLFILGRSFFDKIKARLKFWKAKPSDMNLPDQSGHK